MITKDTSKDILKLPPTEQVVEVFYRRASELIKPAFYALNAAYPMAERKGNPKVEYRFADAREQIKYHRNFHKNTVAEAIIPFVRVIRHVRPFGEDGPTKDFRDLVENQFRMLHKRMKDYADLLLPTDRVEEYCRTLDKVFETERQVLLHGAPPEGLAHYQATPKATDTDLRGVFYGKE